MSACSCSENCRKTADDHLRLTCRICKKLFNNTCVKLTASDVRVINANSKKGIFWQCGFCEALGDDIAGLKSIIVDLKAQVEEMSQRLLAITQKATFDTDVYTDQKYLSVNEVIEELGEREKRRRNLIMFGLPETSYEGHSDKHEQEKLAIKSVLNALAIDNNLQISNFFRIGRSNPNSIRPMKIILEEEKDVYTILQRAKTLKTNPDFSKVYISQDKTPSQMDYFRKVKKELVERKAAGENDIFIRHIKGIPHIVKKN